ncbi:MAG: cytochrome family [Thermoleophilaceae bacterium]|nr:cytochrome family [Thermoleophilaceae bacterium]
MALPPGPSWPPALQTVAWIARPGPFMERARRRYGDAFTVRLAQVGTFVFTTDPDSLKAVFKAGPDRLRAGEANVALEPVLGSRSVLLLDGAEHIRQRRLMLPPFHGERLRGYERLIEEIAEEEMERWPAGTPMPLQPRMQAVTLEVILRVVFGMDRGPELTHLRELIKRLLDVSTKPWALVPPLRRDLGPLTPWAHFLAVRADVDEALYAEIARRRDDPALDERTDIFSLLMQARDDQGEPLSDKELRDELITLLVAGHETTATGLAWAFERLVRHPGGLERLASEDSGDYADAVVQETLRLRPPIPIVARRVVGEPFDLGGRAIPVGVMIAPCIYLVHRRADLYEDPYAFRPERFLERAPETYSWLPFGGGMRRCIGASFAVLEMSTILRTVARGMRLEPAGGGPELIARRAIFLAPNRGGEVVVS